MNGTENKGGRQGRSRGEDDLENRINFIVVGGALTGVVLFALDYMVTKAKAYWSKTQTATNENGGTQ